MRKFLTTLKSNKYTEIKKRRRRRSVDRKQSGIVERDQMILFTRFPLKGLETTNGDAYDIYTLSAICTYIWRSSRKKKRRERKQTSNRWVTRGWKRFWFIRELMWIVTWWVHCVCTSQSTHTHTSFCATAYNYRCY